MTRNKAGGRRAHWGDEPLPSWPQEGAQDLLRESIRGLLPSWTSLYSNSMAFCGYPEDLQGLSSLIPFLTQHSFTPEAFSSLLGSVLTQN